MYHFTVANEEQTIAQGKLLARAIGDQSVCIYLQGDLGAGKTTFTRGLLRAFDYQGAVKSPTYTLVEPYELGQVNIYHFDLYRLTDPEELEFLGVENYFQGSSICIVEWPEKGGEFLPPADIEIHIRDVGIGALARDLHYRSLSLRGGQIIDNLQQLAQSLK